MFARRNRAERPQAANENRGRVMASTHSSSLASPGLARNGASKPSEIRGLFRRFFARAFSPYRPELHYMRGPGPAWRAKHGTDAAFRLTSRDV